MKKITLSIKSYIGLVILLAILGGIYVFLPQSSFLQTQELPASKPVLALINAATMLILYGGLGFLGLKLSQKLDFANVWDKSVSNKQRFLIPALIGIGLGLLFILIDSFFSQFHSFGSLPHPPFPTSLVASAVAGIGEEIIFRLFFISFWVWLISYVILKKKYQNLIFWIVAVFSAFAFAAGHVPSVMMLYDLTTFSEIPNVLLFEIILLNGILSLFSAYFFRKYGFFAPVSIHFWADIIWHVIWGLF